MVAARQRGDFAAAIEQVQKWEGRDANSQEAKWGNKLFKTNILVLIVTL